LNFGIKEGEFISIMGPSGSGKSTLMHILGFLDTLTKGQYKFRGKDVSNLNDDELAALRNKSIGFVFQNFNLLPKTTVWDNVRLPLLYAEGKVDLGIVDQVIESVGLTHRKDYMSNQLSGGEKQRVAIARALVNSPDIVFADEPTGNLDSKSGLQVMSILQELNRNGKTVILVTHETSTAEHAKRIIKLKDGKLVSDDSDFKQKIAKTLTDLK
jgi:putative ABC transport system ATP-binding protein